MVTCFLVVDRVRTKNKQDMTDGAPRRSFNLEQTRPPPVSMRDLQLPFLCLIIDYHTTDALPLRWPMAPLDIDRPQSRTNSVRVREQNRHDRDQL